MDKLIRYSFINHSGVNCKILASCSKIFQLHQRIIFKTALGKSNGLTLIEVLIYVSIFSAMFLVLLGFVFGVLDSSKQINKEVAILQEGNFLQSKINWATAGTFTINNPPLGELGGTLEILGAENFIFTTDGQYLNLNGLKLNSSSVKVENFLTSRGLDSNGKEKVEVSFRIASQNFKVLKYLKQ